MKARANGAGRGDGVEPGADLASGFGERLALALLAACSLVFVVALNLTPIHSKDFWIQLKVGNMIRETGRIPDTVLFSFTEAGDRPFLAYEWLSSLLSSHAFARLGYEGMIVLKCLLVVVVFALMVVLALQINRSLLASLALGSLCVLEINNRCLMRPELLGFLLGLVNLNLLQAFVRSGKAGWLIGLLPTSVLWANVHGSFLLNFALPVIFAVGSVVDAFWKARVEGSSVDRPRLTRLCSWLAVSCLGMLGASLVNPYGFDLFIHVAELSGSDFIRQNILEWKSTFDPMYRSAPFFWLYAAFSLGLLAAIVASFRRLGPFLPLLALGFWILTVVAVRHIPWFVIMGCYVLAHVAKDTTVPRSIWPRTRISAPTGWALVLSVVLLLGAAASAARGNVGGVRMGFRNLAPLNPRAIRFIEDVGLRGNVFNSYAYGDQLVHHFYPRLRVAMDSRLDAYGAKAYLEFRRLSGENLSLLGDPQELLDFLEAHDVRAIVTRPFELRNWAAKGHRRALAAAGWRMAYRDPRTRILIRPGRASGSR